LPSRATASGVSPQSTSPNYSSFGLPVTLTNESNHYCTIDTLKFPNCISPNTPQGNPIEAYEFKMTLRAPAVDGKSSSSFSGTAGSVVLTTSSTNDLIYLVVGSTGNPNFTISDAKGLAWVTREIVTPGTSGRLGTFYAVSAQPLSSDKISVQVTSAQLVSIVVFGISGANPVSPFDPAVGVPLFSTGTSVTPAVSFSTASPGDLIIGSLFVHGAPTLATAKGYTIVKTQPSGTSEEAAAETTLANTAGLQTPAFGIGNTALLWAMVGDAIAGGGASGGSPYLWYLHFPVCNCTIAPNSTPMNTSVTRFSNGTLILKDRSSLTTSSPASRIAETRASDAVIRVVFACQCK